MSRFCVETFLSHNAEKFRRGTLLICVSENFRLRKSLWIREGGSIKHLRRKFLVSQCRKISLENTSVYQKNPGIEKFYASEKGCIRFLRRNFFVSLYQNISLENTSLFQKNSFIEIFHALEGGHHGFVETFCLTGPKRKVL